MINLPLFILDFVVLLPITILRLVIIYLYGSRYNIPNLRILDIFQHSESRYFNDKSVGTVNRSFKEELFKNVEGHEIEEIFRKKRECELNEFLGEKDGQSECKDKTYYEKTYIDKCDDNNFSLTDILDFTEDQIQERCITGKEQVLGDITSLINSNEYF